MAELTRRAARRRRAVRGGHGPTRSPTRPGSTPHGSGSSTPSTAPASTARAVRDWAVHVALVEDGVPHRRSGRPAGARPGARHRRPARAVPPAPDRLRVIVSRTRPPAEALAIAEALDAELVEMGSAGAKAMAIVRGEADVYPHSGGQYEWDSAAPVAVALAAGLHCSRLDGSPLRLQPRGPVPSRPADLPTRARRGRAGGHRLTTADGPGSRLRRRDAVRWR